MTRFILWLLESTLILVCNAFAYSIRALNWIIGVIAWISAVLLVIVAFVAASQFIYDIDVEWRSLILNA